MDTGAEHIRETRAKILAAKKEIKEYLRLPEDARGLLILTHGKGNCSTTGKPTRSFATERVSLDSV